MLICISKFVCLVSVGVVTYSKKYHIVVVHFYYSLTKLLSVDDDLNSESTNLSANIKYYSKPESAKNTNNQLSPPKIWHFDYLIVIV